MTWVFGVDSSFDELSLDEARRLRQAGVQVFAQCLWTGTEQPSPRVTSLQNAKQAGIPHLIGYISVATGRDGAAHVDEARRGIPDEIWAALEKTPIDVELEGLTFEDHVGPALDRSASLGKPKDVYTNFRTWVDILGNPTRPPGTGLWNALWDESPDFDFPRLRYGGWSDDEVWGEQWSGGTQVEGQSVDRNQFRLEAFGVPSTPTPMPPQVAAGPYTNQELINALHDAAGKLGHRSRWELLERAGLNLDEMAQSRSLPYRGLRIDLLPNLSDSEKALVKQFLPASEAPTGGTQGRTNAHLNLRSGPGTQFESLEVLAPGRVVLIVGEQGDWLRVLVDGQAGFVHGDFVRRVAPGVSIEFRLPFSSSWPVTQEYGFDPNYPANGGWHFGIDFGTPTGTPILAAADGRVVKAGAKLPVGFPRVGDGNWGNYVEIEHANAVRSGYAHLSSVEVSAGQKIRQGERIGTSGDTGFTTGPHLHFQCLEGEKRVNPSPFLG